MTAGPSPLATAAPLLAWFDTAARRLPWRVPPQDGQQSPADPYRVWLSEVMLQQTTVAAVIPYFQHFTQRWPRVEDLAAAERAEVLAAWAGLGYYARARNLHACAQAVTALHGGRFPQTEAGLRTLPGIGGYTAAAVAAIAFGQPAPVMDGNIERVMARLFAIEQPLPGAKPVLQALVASQVPAERPGDYAQALMDLGAGICTPRRPSCLACPLQPHCAGAAQGIQETLPRKAPKAEKPQRRGMALALLSADGENLLLRRRPPSGLLGGMAELPSAGWSEGDAVLEPIRALAPRWQALARPVRHVFTHFALELTVEVARLPAGVPPILPPPLPAPELFWQPVGRLAAAGLPTLMRKAALPALDALLAEPPA